MLKIQLVVEKVQRTLHTVLILIVQKRNGNGDNSDTSKKNTAACGCRDACLSKNDRMKGRRFHEGKKDEKNFPPCLNYSSKGLDAFRFFFVKKAKKEM